MSKSNDVAKMFEGLAAARGQTQPAPPQPPPGPADPPPTPLPRPAGPKGRRRDPAYRQAAVILPEALDRRIRMLLMAEGRGRDFSELVEELLTGWSATRTIDQG